MLQDYTPSIIEEMDHYDVTRQCWQCAHYRTSNGKTGHCSSLGMAQVCRDMTGVSFSEDIKLPVREDTDAGLCCEFVLSASEQVRAELMDILDDARLMARRHADHYQHLRRCAHA